MAQIRFHNITKKYQECISCRDISFEIKHGSIHAIIGENGAGKSTLMKILGGLVEPTSGEMFINETIYKPKSAKDADSNGIAIIHQHFMLARQLTVLENILLSFTAKDSTYKFLPKKHVIKKTVDLLAKFKWSIQINEKVENISVGDQQRLEIIKALLNQPDIIIFDEPTAVLTPQESDDLLDFMQQLKTEGKTIILISHKLNEVKKVSDRITVLRSGQVIETKNTEDLLVDEIAELMIGRKSKKVINSTKSNGSPTSIQLPFSNIKLIQNEIFGVAGIEGNGQNELIADIRKQLIGLKISFGDITEDRIPLSVFSELNLAEHVLLKHPKKFSVFGLIKKKLLYTFTKDLINRWNIQPGLANYLLKSLSGGNQQKFIVGREMAFDPDFLIAAHPTRGVDIGSQEFIHSAMIQFAKDLSKPVLLVSADLDEVLTLSDRFVIIYKKQIFGPFKKFDINEKEIGRLMTGATL